MCYQLIVLSLTWLPIVYTPRNEGEGVLGRKKLSYFERTSLIKDSQKRNDIVRQSQKTSCASLMNIFLTQMRRPLLPLTFISL